MQVWLSVSLQSRVYRASHRVGAQERITELLNCTLIHCAQFTKMREKSFKYKTTQFCYRTLARDLGFSLLSVSAALHCLRFRELCFHWAQILPRSGAMSNSLSHTQLKQRDHDFKNQLGCNFVVVWWRWWWPSFW